MRAKWITRVMVLAGLAAGAVPAAAGTFTSGSTGADGPFSPICATPCTVTVTLPASGTFNYTTGNIPPGITVKYTRNATNTPVTLLFTGNVTIAGTIDLNGSPGADGQAATATSSNGGASGPGGGNGGSGGTTVPSNTNTAGSTGLGPGGGQGGRAQNKWCGGGGGGFGTAGAQGQSGAPLYCDPALTPPPPGPGGPAYGHPALLPLLGGSGGGGGAGGLGYTGGGGGGGGGALLVASSGTITFTGGITANGGGGGAGLSAGTAGAGGGGSGGGVRLVATTITGTGGSLNVNGGPKGIGTGNAFNGGDGGVGRIRVETYTLSASIVFSTYPSLTFPGSVSLSGTPSLTITAVAGVSVPANPAGTFGSPDVILPTATGSSISVALSAANVPAGASLKLQVTPQMGNRPAAVTGTLSGTSHTFSGVTIPLDQPFRVDAEASFNLTAWLHSPIQYAGEEVTTVRVTAALGTGTGRGAHLQYFTASGREVPADAVLSLGLPR